MVLTSETKVVALFLTSANLTVEIYNSLSGGNLVYTENFTNGIANGSWNVMLGENSSNPLSLEFGKVYYKDYLINGGKCQLHKPNRRKCK